MAHANVVRESFAFTSSKGGAGKSTLVFNTAAQYAFSHPDDNILVVDFSIFGDVSALMLGGCNFKEDKLVDNGRMRMTHIVQGKRTSADMILAMINFHRSHGASSWFKNAFFSPEQRFKFEDYCVALKDFNEENRSLPANLFISIGTEAVSQIVPPQDLESWKHVKDALLRSLDSPASPGEKRWVIFFDTDHDLTSMHAQLALATANKIIIPMSTNPNDYARLCRIDTDKCLLPTLKNMHLNHHVLRAKIHLVIFNRVVPGGNVKDDEERGLFSPCSVPEPERNIMSTICAALREYLDVRNFWFGGSEVGPRNSDFCARYAVIVPQMASNVLKYSEENGIPVCCIGPEVTRIKAAGVGAGPLENAQSWIRLATERLDR